MVCQDTHVTSCSCNIHLDNIFGGENSLRNILNSIPSKWEELQLTHLVRKNQGKANFVSYFSVSSSLLYER